MMASPTSTPEKKNNSTSSASESSPEATTLVTVPYASTTECEPPVPMVPPKSQQRNSKGCSGESTPKKPASLASSVYAASVAQTPIDRQPPVSEAPIQPPPLAMQANSASIYELLWEEVFPTEEICDDATGLPAYIAPYIIRSGSEVENISGPDWPAVRPLQPVKKPQASAGTEPAEKREGDMESIKDKFPKKKRNFWMSFRRSKKADAASAIESIRSPQSTGTGQTAQATPDNSNFKKEQAMCSTPALKVEDSVDELPELTESNTTSGSVARADDVQSRRMSLVPSVTEVKYSGVSISEVEFAESAISLRMEDRKLARYGEMGHTITMLIPEGKLFNDELRARFCC